ncbi:PaaI family thioesterase [Breoghania sp.]|uniref:PaaI family thioesterase n=1 Tax=Breoghania sp. TaxID=2065378 RepID=UPI002AA79303|nr:PaaI family thioesterase [Breoghania sp.]
MNDEPIATGDTSRYGLATREEIAHLSGLEIIQALLSRKLPAPPMARTLDFDLREVSEGEAVFVGRPSLAFYNPLGTVHGGWAATLLDSALGCAVQTTLAAGEGYTTLEFKVNCTRPILENSGEMICEGRVVHRGRRTATAEATLKDADGKLYAHGSETCMIFAP